MSYLTPRDKQFREVRRTQLLFQKKKEPPLQRVESALKYDLHIQTNVKHKQELYAKFYDNKHYIAAKLTHSMSYIFLHVMHKWNNAFSRQQIVISAQTCSLHSWNKQQLLPRFFRRRLWNNFEYEKENSFRSKKYLVFLNIKQVQLDYTNFIVSTQNRILWGDDYNDK